MEGSLASLVATAWRFDANVSLGAAAELWRSWQASTSDDVSPDASSNDVLTASAIAAVAVSVLGSILTVCGTVLQKKAVSGGSAHQHRQVGSVVVSPQWVLGFVVGVVTPIPAQLIAYRLAPMSLTTPLSGITVALNAAAAPRLLGERLQPLPDVPACFFILVGTGLTVAAGSKGSKNGQSDEPDLSVEGLFALMGTGSFLIALAILISLMVTCLVVSGVWRAEIARSAKSRPENPDLRHVLLPAFLTAGFGCLTNIMLKGVVELFKAKSNAWIMTLWSIAAVIPGLAQLNYLNCGLRLYQQSVFFPIYSALLVLTNTVYGLIFYHEYVELTGQVPRCIVFALGVATVTFGVSLFACRRPQTEATNNTPELVSPLAGISLPTLV